MIGAAADRRVGRLRRPHLGRRRRHQRRRLPRPRRRSRGDRRGPHRQLAAARADDRHPHDRRRRRLASRASPSDGTLTVGPESAGAAARARCATAPAARSPPSPTPTWCSAASRRTCSAARSPLDVDRARRPSRSAWPGRSACAGGGRAGHPRHREQQHGRRAPPGVGRARLRPARLRAGALRRRRPAARRRPRRAARHAARSSCRATRACSRPSACSAPRCATTTRARSLQKPPDYDLAAVGAVYAELEEQARAWLAAEGVAADRAPGHAPGRPALRHQGFELTVPWPERDLADRRRCWRASTSATASSTRTRWPRRRSRSSRCASPRAGRVRRFTHPVPRAARRHAAGALHGVACTSPAPAGRRARASSVTSWARARS